jgi:hypothetical protein
MAVPAVPTVDDIVLQGCKKANAVHYIAEAKNEWMEEIKNDILVLAGDKKLKMLHTTAILVTTNGQSRYSMPFDFYSDMTLTVMDGDITGTAQAGAVGSITLAASDTQTESGIIGKYIFIYEGTGVNGYSQCTAFNDTTKVASVTPDFATAPDSTSKYMIVDSNYVLQQKPIWELEEIVNQTSHDRPTHYFPVGDENYTEFVLYPNPYRASEIPFAMKLRYYANLMTSDLTSTLMATLYQRWRNVWVQGIYAKALQRNEDSQADKEMSRYNQYLQALMMREIYETDLSNVSASLEG